MTRLFLFSLIASLLLGSCTRTLTKGLDINSHEARTFESDLFSTEHGDLVYRAGIDAYGNHFSGLLIFKAMAVQEHRVVFTTEFGNRLFDITMDEGELKVNQILQEMDRPVLLSLLEKDFSLLLRQRWNYTGSLSQGEKHIMRSKDGPGSNFLFIDDEVRRLKRIVHRQHMKDKVSIDIYSSAQGVGDSIRIEHLRRPLSIQLRLIEN